ncbi:MAG TPA: thymidine phosphorylase [Alphaproteobacteria bacterium]|nr:thymidine phosphorylase [Alphaproteobacteria bacterium]
MLPQEIIRHKRNKQILTKEEIDFFIKGVTNEKISDAQIGALTMAVFLNGLTDEEKVNLTTAMRDSGDVLSWNLNGPVVDKHSTGGVGDKVSLVLGPILAACGAYVPMISGRGLGHTGGTLDKLDSIQGYQTAPSNDLFQKTVQKVGCAIIGQTGNLAPADKRIYAVRDVCATVESIPLITASILSKKLASGIDHLVMDVKFGNGAFMESMSDARALAQSIVNVANGAGTKTTALLTDMNAVLGDTVGNALEVFESVQYLKGEKINKRLDEVTKALCAEILVSAKLAIDEKEAYQKIEKALSSGLALEKFEKMVQMLGGPADFANKPFDYMPKASIIRPVFAQSEGYIQAMSTRDIGLLLIELKGGRTHPTQTVDHATGFTDFVQIGDKIDVKTPLCYVHAQNEADYQKVSAELHKFIIIGEKPKEQPIILEKIR